MTDKYHNEHDTSDAFADGQVDGQQEVWSDQSPPTDDFADMPEEASVQVEGDEPDMASAEANAGAAPKKKASMVLPVAVGVAGLIFLGGMVYMQFFSGPDLPTAVPMTAPSVAPSAAGQVTTATGSAVVASATTPQSFDPLSVKQADGSVAPMHSALSSSPEQRPALAGMPAPALQSETVLPSKQPDVGMLVQPVTGATSPVDTGVPAMAEGRPSAVPSQQPVAGADMMPLPAKKDDVSAMASPVLVPPSTNAVVPVVAPAATPSVSVGDSQMKARVDELQRTVDRLSQQLDQVGGTVATIHSAPPVPAGLDDRLGKLEQELMKLQQSLATKSPVQREPSKVVSAQARGMSVERVDDVAPRRSPVAKPQKALAKKSTKPETKSRVVLRAAAPGEAWVANDMTTSEIRPVRVGDKVAGIGEVTAIRQDDRGWVVEGTKGALR